MKRIIPIVIAVCAVITTVLFIVNIKEKNGAFFYRLGFTILYEILFIAFFGVSADYKGLSFIVRISYFIFIILATSIGIALLFLGSNIFPKFALMSKTMTSSLLIVAGIEIVVSFMLFAAGNLLHKKS